MEHNLTECCAKCIYCKPCKEFNSATREWKWFNVCIALVREKDGWCLSINNPECEHCEMFAEIAEY